MQRVLWEDRFYAARLPISYRIESYRLCLRQDGIYRCSDFFYFFFYNFKRTYYSVQTISRTRILRMHYTRIYNVIWMPRRLRRFPTAAFSRTLVSNYICTSRVILRECCRLAYLIRSRVCVFFFSFLFRFLFGYCSGSPVNRIGNELVLQWCAQTCWSEYNNY